MSQKKYETHRDLPTSHLNNILQHTYRGATVEATLEDGYLLRTPSGSMTKVSNAEMTKLTQRFVHNHEFEAEQSSVKAREYLDSNPQAKAEFDAGVRGYQHGRGEGNPFADKDGNRQGQTTFGNPDVGKGQPAGWLPSDDAPKRHEVRTQPAHNPNTGLLPSDPRFDHSFKG